MEPIDEPSCLDLDMNLVIMKVTLSPLETKRLENCTMGFMWPAPGSGTTSTWLLFTIFSISLTLSVGLIIDSFQ